MIVPSPNDTESLQECEHSRESKLPTSVIASDQRHLSGSRLGCAFVCIWEVASGRLTSVRAPHVSSRDCGRHFDPGLDSVVGGWAKHLAHLSSAGLRAEMREARMGVSKGALPHPSQQDTRLVAIKFGPHE